MARLTVTLDIPERFIPQAEFALRELVHRMGFGLNKVSGKQADILYSADGKERPCRVRIRFNPALYEPNTHCVRRETGGHVLWSSGEADPLAIDLIGGAYRLLTCQDEHHVSEADRDHRGVFLTTALDPERRNTVSDPIVEAHAEFLSELLNRTAPDLTQHAAPLWPDNKQYAVILTHDVDHVHAGAPAELATSLAKAVLRRDRHHWELFRLGVPYLLRPRANPFFRFPWWRDWEERQNLRSAFYFFIRPFGVQFDKNDCKSSVAGQAADWTLFRAMAEAGWEFGVHASLHTKDTPGAFACAKEWLEQRVGHRVAGIRHHYFALDWRLPARTHRLHAEAGFRYDSSIAWRDQAGFRTGTSLPHQVYDTESGETLPLTVLPCSIMDNHVICSDVAGTRVTPGEAVVRALEVARKVKRYRGMLVFNWHQESAFNRLIFDGYSSILEQIISKLDLGNAWVGSPADLCSHWNDRITRLYGD